MRILVVSAHYPPNFVSGGTLQPQRLVREMHRRGHQVSVYAGHLDADRSPLSTWVEDDGGIPIRWIATTPFTEWRDRRSWDNPAVAADFRGYVRSVRPELVHIHGLQGLGAGVVHAAAEARIPVIVTMHDFWWVCGRQFLCNRDFRPCSLVTDAGSCPCEVSVRWRRQRTATLEAALSAVDVVLAPSAIAADVLAANGVDPARLRVDENGFERASEIDAVAGNAGRTSSASVRFVYTGGSDRMKGVHDLVTAAETLRAVAGWELTAFGVDRYLDESKRSLDGLPVHTRAPYGPAELMDVFSHHDVLVVPSVMRETHSLVTREALRHGLAVICTDTLGPEEVVHDGVNGIVVRAAVPSELAAAMRTLTTDRESLGRMQAAAPDVELRSLDDQVDGLEALYRDVVTARAGQSAAARGSGQKGGHARTVADVLFVTGIDGAPFRYRVRLPAEALATAGIRSQVLHYRDARLDRHARRAGAVVLYRVPATTQVLGLLRELGDLGIPRYFDIDDLIIDSEVPNIPALELLQPDEAALWIEGVKRYRTTLDACDAVITSTEPLARHIRAVTGREVHVFENGVGMALARQAEAALAGPRTPGPQRIGYLSGTDTHDLDWALVERAVVRVLQRNPDVELWVGGHLRVSDALDPFSTRVRRLPFVPWLELPAVLRDLDVNLAPLVPIAFNEAKSAIKWLEAALVETPTVASSTEPFRAAITDGTTGFIAPDDDTWVDAIERLLRDEHLRRRTGALARRDALLRWAPRLQGRRYAEILASSIDRTSDAAPRPAEVVALDEPASGIVALEPYRADPSVAARAAELTGLAASRGRLAGSKLVDSVRTEGVVATSKRSVRWSFRVARSKIPKFRS